MCYAQRVLIYQTITGVLLTGVGLLFELQVALMILIGSGASTLGTSLLALSVLGPYTTQAPDFLVQRFYLAELLKVITVIIIFVLTFLLIKEVNPMALLGGYFVTQVFPTTLAALQSDGSE